MEGIIFNIQRFSIHDGPGIRTTVFLKGCPLRCIWCHNPESNRTCKELMYYKSLCTGCGACVEKCPRKLISIKDGVLLQNHEGCIACGACVSVCPNKAREIMGYTDSADNVLAEVIKDEKFYRHSGGGMTVSGGEPLNQPDFVAELLSKAKARGIDTAIETCGFAPRKSVEKVFPYVDTVLFDIKHMDSATHKALTGVNNEQILDNLMFAAKTLNKKIWIRMPLIAGVNDSSFLIRQTAAFLKEIQGNIAKVYLLPYHTLGLSKLESLGKSTAPCDNYAPPSKEHLEELAAIFEAYGFEALIG